MSASQPSSLLDALQSLPCRRPWTLLLVAVALAALGGYLYAFHLEIQSGRDQLSNPDRPLNQRLENYREEFHSPSVAVFVIAAAAPEDCAAAALPDAAARAAMKRVARNLGTSLRARPDLFPAVVERVPLDDMGPLALLYLPTPAFDATAQAVARSLPDLSLWARRPTLQNAFEIANTSLRDLGPDAGSAEASAPVLASGVAVAEAFFRWLRTELALADTGQPLAQAVSPLVGAGELDLDGYLFQNGGRLLIVAAEVSGDFGQPNQFGSAIEYSWRAIDDAVASAGAGLVQAGVAGMPALEYDEVASSQVDFARGAVIALVLVSALFMGAFGALVRPALAALCLLLSIGITFVFAWLTIGHLNLLALVFAIILVALGIDFAIHFAIHYEHALAESADPRRGVRTTLARIGGALWLGGLTSAAAFLAAGATEAPGLSELGVIAGGGLLICLAVMWFVYPALLYLVDRRWQPRVTPRWQAAESLAIPARTSPALRVLFAVTLVLAALGYARGQYEFDTNLLALHPEQGRAAAWQRALLATDDRAQFALATYDDRATLEAARARFDATPELVRGTDSVFPADEAHKRRALEPLCQQLQSLEVAPAPAPSVRDTRRALFGLRQAVRRLGRATPDATVALAGLEREIELTYTALSALPAENATARLSRIDNELGGSARSTLAALSALCCPPAFALELAPAVLRERFVGKSGRLSLLVYPAENTWHRPELERFVTAGLEIEPELFGGTINFLDNAHAMVSSFAKASLYALGAVLLLVWLGCRSWRDTALAMFPLLTSIGLLLLFMQWTPWAGPWNFGNFFALPILIGIGVDSGIHLTRGWRESVATFRGARRAVLVSTLTTLTGFGVLSFSQHLGVRSLGIILTIGIAFVLLTSIVLMPVALRALIPCGPPDD